jgi:hypothetical protein
MELTIPIVKFKMRTINIIVLISLVISFALFIVSFKSGTVKSFIREYKYFYSAFFGLSIISFWIVPLIYTNYKIIGSLIINNIMIKATVKDQFTVEYPIGKIKQIQFDFNDTASDGGRSVRIGINNFITILDESSISQEFQLLIKNQHALDHLNKKLDFYSKAVPVVKTKKGKTIAY